MALVALPRLAVRLLHQVGAASVAVVFGLATQSASAQEDRAMVEVHTLNDRGVEAGQAGALGVWRNHSPVLKADTGRPKQLDDWIRISFLRAPTSTPVQLESAWQIELSDSSQMRGRPAGGDADRLLWAWGTDAELLLIPVDLLWLRGFARERLPRAGADQETDLLDLQTSAGGIDRRSGWLEEISNEGLRFAEGERVFDQDWQRVAGLRLLEEEPAELPPEWELLEFVDGSFLPVVVTGCGAKQLSADLMWGGSVAFPYQSLRAIWRGGGGGLDLTQLDGRQQEFDAGKVLSFSPQIHRSVSGQSLRVAERRFSRGIGVRAPTQLSWQLEQAGVFHCWVGVDDAVQRHRDPAPLRFQVWLDGEMLIESEPMRVGQMPAPLRVELPRAGKLELRCISQGEDGASGRHGNWIHPRVWNSVPSGL